MAEKILLYRSGALGDTLLTLPAMDSLRRRFPAAGISLAAHPSYASPLLDAGRVDAVLDATSVPFHLLHQNPSGGSDELDLLLEGFDMLILYTNRGEENALTRRLQSKYRGKWILSPPFPPEGKPIHASAWMTQSLSPLGVPSAIRSVSPLVPSQESLGAARQLLEGLGLGKRPVFGIHPGSGGRAKWPPFEPLARIAENFCREHSARPLLIRGPADGDACGEFLGKWGAPLPALETSRLEVLAGVTALLEAYLGGDSGVSHLAALCGTPTLALFGPASDPLRWKPIGEWSDWISWDEGPRGWENLKRLTCGRRKRADRAQ